MNIQKTGYVWVLIVLVGITTIVVLLNFILLVTNLAGMPAINYIVTLLLAIGFVVNCIWLNRALSMKKDLIKWTHALCAVQVIYGLVSFKTEEMASDILTLLIVALIWFTFVQHLTSKALEVQPTVTP